MNNYSEMPIVTVTLNPAIDRTLHLPTFALGQVNRVESERTDPGGKGINVAKVIKALKHPVLVTGFLGTNNTAVFQNYFKKENIHNHFVETAGENRVNIKIVDMTNDVVSELNFPGITPTTLDLDHLLDTLRQLAATHKWFVLSGSLPPGWPTDTYATLIRQIQAQGVKVLLDTSGAALREALEARPEIIKPNREELAECLGCKLDSPASIVNAARRLLAAHPGMTLVVVSMGHEGALFVTPEQVITALPLPIEPISSVGAGDAMVAGVIAAQLAAFPLPQSAQLATAFAAGKLTRLGAHLPARDVVQRLAEQVRLKTENHF